MEHRKSVVDKCGMVTSSFLIVVLLGIFFKCCSSLINCPTQYLDSRLYADCSRLSLISTYGIAVTSSTQILNLAHNEFQKLHNRQFQVVELTRLEEINLQFNLINVIESETFDGVPLLSKLDLSHNKISFMQINFLPTLKFLNLSFNPLQYSTVNISSPSLQVLDLFQTQIADFDLLHFGKLKNLVHLNISRNNLHFLRVSSIEKTPLKTLRISRNPLFCNEDTDKLLQWLQMRNVDFTPICFHRLNNFGGGETFEPEINDLHAIPMQGAFLPQTNFYDNQPYYPPEPPFYPPPNPLPDRQIKTFFAEQRMFGIITVTLLGLLLIVIATFLGVYIFYAFRQDRKADRQTAPGPDVVIEEVPPPPYRNNTYLEGFTI